MTKYETGDRVIVTGISSGGTKVENRKGTVLGVSCFPKITWVHVSFDKNEHGHFSADFNEQDCRRLVKKRKRLKLEFKYENDVSVPPGSRLFLQSEIDKEIQRRVSKVKLFGRTIWEITYPGTTVYTEHSENYDVLNANTVTEFVEVIKK